MENDLFRDAVEQACDLGFDAFGLTPVIGEVFLDPAFERKVPFLEEQASVRRYWLTINFTTAEISENAENCSDTASLRFPEASPIAVIKTIDYTNPKRLG